jgi:hypothetical protein
LQVVAQVAHALVEVVVQAACSQAHSALDQAPYIQPQWEVAEPVLYQHQALWAILALIQAYRAQDSLLLLPQEAAVVEPTLPLQELQAVQVVQAAAAVIQETAV